MTIKKKKTNIIYCFGLSVSAVLCLLLATLIIHPEKLDDVILMEKRNQGYWNNLSPDAAATRIIPVSFFKGDKSANLLAPKWQEVTNQGVTASVNEDGSVTITGTNTGGDFNLTTTAIDLPVGEYCYTNNLEGNDFVSASGVWMYIWQGIACDTLHTLPYFTVEEGEEYHTGIHIDAGAADLNITFYPMIRIIGTNAKYKSYDEQTMEIDTYEISDEVTEDDVRIFFNRATRAENVNTITLEDGRGIEVCNSVVTYGKINRFGLVEKIISEPKTPDELHELLAEQKK